MYFKGYAERNICAGAGELSGGQHRAPAHRGGATGGGRRGPAGAQPPFFLRLRRFLRFFCLRWATPSLYCASSPGPESSIQ